jgi:metal-responsive CopG/Arc/MetJ family transcriptional regulator
MAKINISLPDALLTEIDEVAAELHGSRSALVQEATALYLARVREERARAERRASIDRALASARELGAKLGPFDSTASIRADRDRDATEEAGR